MGVTKHTKRSRLRAVLRDDSGIAMIIVVGVVSVLFLLTTMLIVVSNYMLAAGRQQEISVKSVHLADAGLNAYLYALRNDSTFYATNPTLGPIVQEDGVWIVRATAPTQDEPLMLESEGRLSSQTTSKTVIASVRFPTFADYMFLSNADINIGSGATIRGKVRSNSYVINAGDITGETYAVGTITGGGLFGSALPTGSQTKFPGSKVVDFSQVTADTDLIKAAAQSVGTYYATAGSTYYGYRVTVSGSTYTVQKVKTLNTSTGVMTLEAVTGGTNVPIPAVGVLYFAGTTSRDNIYISGTYSKPISVVCEQNIYVVGNYVPDSMTSRNTAGLIAVQNIIVPIAYTSVPTDMTIAAATLAQKGTVYGEQTTGVIKNSITILGAESYYTYGYFVTMSGSTVVAGFRTRNYNYDQRLDLFAPPRYPVVRDGSLKVNTWVEN
jgi:hypothetical protein